MSGFNYFEGRREPSVPVELRDTDQAPYSAPTPQTATVSDEAVQAAVDGIQKVSLTGELISDEELAIAALNGAFPHIISQIVTKPVDVAAVREQCASIADEFARSRPLITKRPSSLIVGRWEGEQAAACAIATAIRALSPAEPVDQWQDISTAPKNGGFLAANSKEVWAAWHYDSANWHAKYGSRGATHWMPLPSAPTSKGGE